MKKTVITYTLCASLIALTAVAQSRTGERLSRQMTSLKNMMESFANNIRPRITTLETEMDAVEGQVNTLTQRENRRTACNDIPGDTSIYWPDHPAADGSGCVSHTAMKSEDGSGSATGCPSRSVTWSPGCSGTLITTFDGLTATAVKHGPGECGGSGYEGRATYLCTGGQFVLQPGSTCNRVNEWSGDCR